jgi:hypothetical protein
MDADLVQDLQRGPLQSLQLLTAQYAQPIRGLDRL